MKINLSMFLMMIHTLCTIHNASVTSWIRTVKRNRALGGRIDSRHLIGMAVDLVCDSAADKPLIISAAHRLGLDAIDEGDHIHIEADKRTD